MWPSRVREWHQVRALFAVAAARWLQQAPDSASHMAAEAAATNPTSSLHIGFFHDQFRHNALVAFLGRSVQSSRSILRRKKMAKSSA